MASGKCPESTKDDSTDPQDCPGFLSATEGMHQQLYECLVWLGTHSDHTPLVAELLARHLSVNQLAVLVSIFISLGSTSNALVGQTADLQDP